MLWFDWLAKKEMHCQLWHELSKTSLCSRLKEYQPHFSFLSAVVGINGGNPIPYKKTTATSELSRALVPWDSEWNGRDWCTVLTDGSLFRLFLHLYLPLPLLLKHRHTHTHQDCTNTIGIKAPHTCSLARSWKLSPLVRIKDAASLDLWEELAC